MADLKMTKYEYSKQVVKSMSPMDPIEWASVLAKLQDYILDNEITMLYCKELSDFTIFMNCVADAPESFAGQELTETLNNRGKLIYVEETDDGAWEIWVRQEEDNFCYYLFDFTEAVVRV